MSRTPTSRSRRSWRWGVGVLVGMVMLAVPGTAYADPAGPTDYRSEIVSVEPSTTEIDVEVIGGDSFVQLVAEPGTEVIVVGYDGEQNIWFRPDGTVWENRNSPSTYLNEERYGNEVPEGVRADAEPDWRLVGDGGRWAWHDHRAHWMQQTRPLAAGPGDQILEAVIPLDVNGERVEVTVISTWLDPPSRVPQWLGVVAGVALVAAAWTRRGRIGTLALVAVPLAAAALVVGVVQYFSLPLETGPSIVWWGLPAIGLVGAIAAAVLQRRGQWFAGSGLVLLTGVELVLWGIDRRDGLSAAIIPTDLPGWFDRLVTAGGLAGGVALTLAAAAVLFVPAANPQLGVSGSREPSG